MRRKLKIMNRVDKYTDMYAAYYSSFFFGTSEIHLHKEKQIIKIMNGNCLMENKLISQFESSVIEMPMFGQNVEQFNLLVQLVPKIVWSRKCPWENGSIDLQTNIGLWWKVSFISSISIFMKSKLIQKSMIPNPPLKWRQPTTNVSVCIKKKLIKDDK